MLTKAATPKIDASEPGCLMCRGLVPPPGARCKVCGRAGKPIPHRCHAIDCTEPVPPKMLMCREHWRMVPAALKRRVWATYVPGQEVRKDPTAEYLAAHIAAVEAAYDWALARYRLARLKGLRARAYRKLQGS